MSIPESAVGQFRKGESFSAQGDDGRIHLVTTWVEYVDKAECLSGRPQWETSGFECLRSEDGRAVQVLVDGRYEVASSGIVLKRIASAAEPGVPTDSNDERLMAYWDISLAGGQYVFAAFRYDRLADAVAYAQVERARFAS